MKRTLAVRVELVAAVVALATLLAVPGLAQAQCYDEAGASANITAPLNNGFIQLGYDEMTPELTVDVSLTFTATFPGGAGADDRAQVYLDGVLVEANATSPYLLEDVPVGAHIVAVHLHNLTAGADYCNGVNAKRFYVSRVCFSSNDCADADPCTEGSCIAQSGLGAWTGRCRFGVSTDPDCCVASDWCAQRGLTFGEGQQYMCADVDDDPSGECVQCTVDGDCPIYSVCQTGATCNAENVCEYTYDPNCCETDAACNDGNACTTDSCDLGTNTCDNDYIAGCCVAGLEDELPGDGTFGCTPAGASPCDNWVCLGQAAAARCRVGRLFANCCGQDSECNNSRLITSCTDPDGDGFGVCDETQSPDPLHPDAHVCTYEVVDEDCCEKAYQCADEYPEQIGVCQDQPGLNWDICVYSPNPEYCSSPVAGLVISEVMVDASHISDPASEWFEIFNPTEVDVDINGWTVAGDAARLESFVITAGAPVIVPAGGFATLAASGAPEVNGGFVPDYVYDPADLSFGSNDGLFLFDASLAEVSGVTWAVTWAAWGPGASMALIHPYLDESLESSWSVSKLRFGAFGSVGTPGSVNRDVFDETLTGAIPGHSCDDGLPCTLDVCNLSAANVCSHMPLFDCCEVLGDCNDYNVCTEESCGTVDNPNQCVHDYQEGCCLTDADCVGAYPPVFTSAADQANFDICAVKVCLGGSCRFGRDSERPGCCVATDAGLGFGCGDRNTCTVDACEADAGGSGGDTYPACTYDYDLNDDGIFECCRSSADCDDGDPSTRDFCNLNANSEVCLDGAFRCCFLPDPNYCTNQSQCDDGDPCTQDYCCAGAGAPDAACTEANQCAHVALPVGPDGGCCRSVNDCKDGQACTLDVCCTGGAEDPAGCTEANVCYNPEVTEEGCCQTHADCRGLNKPSAMFCREGYCIGSACRYAPPADADCCVTAADCGADPCTTYACTANQCVGTPVENCCQTAADCADPANPLGSCQTYGCQANQCAVLEIPGCCEDDNPDGPDESCDDGNPCTADYCTAVSATLSQCRHFNVGGVSCCSTAASCPDDGVQCTTKGCEDNACTLSPETDCVARSPYTMTFSEGHAAYAGQYETLADIAWTVLERGANPAGQFFGFATAGALGPDRHLAFVPTGQAVNFESCAVMPRFNSAGSNWGDLTFEYATDWLMGTGELKVIGKHRDTGAWELVQSIALIADAGATPVAIDLPYRFVDSVNTQFAFCVTAATTDNMNWVAIDTVSLVRRDTP